MLFSAAWLWYPSRGSSAPSPRSPPRPGKTFASHAFNILFFGDGRPRCLDTADANDDGALDTRDGIYSLSYLFLGSVRPPEPFPDCGVDPTADELRCELFERCEDG